MNKLKKIIIKSPEYYLIIVTILSGYSQRFLINPIALGVVAIVILQIVFKNKISGLIISSLFLLVNLFMIGALISEFNEFPTFNNGAKKLLFGGLFILGLNIFVSILMIIKYTNKAENDDCQVECSL